MAKKKEKAAAPATSPEDILGNKLEALNNTLANIHKDYGEDKLFLLGSNEHADVEVISTGSLGVDHALGVGGLPRGRIIEIYGPESSGKTTLAIHAIAEAQKNGGIAALIDAEHAFVKRRLERIREQVHLGRTHAAKGAHGLLHAARAGRATHARHVELSGFHRSE